MSSRVCVRCGSAVPLKVGRGRPRKYCDRCTPSRSTRAVAPAAPAVSTVDHSGLYASTLAELTEAGVVSSMAAQAALLLAQRIESNVDSGSSIAQMVRQLVQTSAAAIQGAPAIAADPVDEFTARRRERGA